MSTFSVQPIAALALALLCTLCPSWATAQPKAYATADEAASAFVGAIATNNDAAMRTVLGANYTEVLPPLQKLPDADKFDFLAAWAQSHRVVPQGDSAAVLEVGASHWVMPLPMVKKAAGWVFDLDAGAHEIALRRIGRNELAALEAALAYYDMQKEYASKERVPGQGRVYAQRFRSSPGKMDGLFWPASAGQDLSPMGPDYAVADADGAYHGYFYRILTGQGPHANGGAYDYVNKGRMNAGFALIAWPARYGATGVMSFMVNHDGVVWQKDLGPQGSAVARQMRRFDPDPSWTVQPVPSAVAAAGGTK